MSNLETGLKDPLNEYKFWNFGVWNGPFFCVMMGIFWGLLGHCLPAMSGSLSADQVAAIISADHNYIRVGMAVSMTFVFTYVIWTLGLSKVMSKIIGKDSILIDFQTWGGGLTCVAMLISMGLWMTAAYRPGLPATQLMQLYDNGWVYFDLGYAPTSVQMFALAFAFLSDKREKPLVPRWVAWFGVFVGVAFLAENLMPFFYQGIFSRSGLMNYWFEYGCWFFWNLSTSFFVIKAIKRLKRESLES